jgi:hypothetical protein
VSFPGCHGDLGWVEDAKGLVNAPLAWIAQQVHTHLRIELDEIEMGKRFRNYRPEGATEPTALPTWYKGKVERLAPVTLALMGKKSRTPGRVDISYPNDLTGLKLHIGASIRNLPSRAKILSQDTTVIIPTTGTSTWVRKEAIFEDPYSAVNGGYIKLQGHTSRTEKNNRVSGETDLFGKPTYESFWLFLCPTETDGTYFRAGLNIEKKSIETIRGDLGERTVTVV